MARPAEVSASVEDNRSPRCDIISARHDDAIVTPGKPAMALNASTPEVDGGADDHVLNLALRLE